MGQIRVQMEEYANVLVQILNPGLVGQKIKLEPILQAPGRHLAFAVRYALLDPSLSGALPLKRYTSSFHSLLPSLLPPCSPPCCSVSHSSHIPFALNNVQ